MPTFYRALFPAVGLFFACAASQAQEIDTQQHRVVVAAPALGLVIDAQEKATYGLFPYYSANEFVQAQFARALAPDSALVLYSLLRNGRTVARPFSEADFRAVGQQVEARALELQQARQNQPTPSRSQPETIGQTYSVELNSGTSFIGVLTAIGPEFLEFDTKDLGHLRIPRPNIKLLTLLTQEQTRRGWAPVGNGTRLFFAPTARNLRRGEGYVQSVDIIFLGANYGVTDNISIGALGLLPIGGEGGLLALTPKFSAKVSEKFHVGAGALVSRAFSTTFGIGYGVATYGSADQNLTLGLGYAFAEGEYSSSPVVVVGGATRVSRRLSLLNETYIAEGGFLGLLGVRAAGQQLSGSLGFAYGSVIGTIYPAYLEVAYRFGTVK